MLVKKLTIIKMATNIKKGLKKFVDKVFYSFLNLIVSQGFHKTLNFEQLLHVK